VIESSRGRTSGRTGELVEDISPRKIARGPPVRLSEGATVSKPLPAEGRVNPGYRWAILAVSVVAQATFLGAVFQGLPALGPVLRSAAARAKDALWGSNPIRTFMGAHLRFGRTSVPSACAKDTPTSCHAHTSFETLRPPRSLRRDASLEQASPSRGRAGSSRAIPKTGTLEA
jgi:hypothetical protein